MTLAKISDSNRTLQLVPKNFLAKIFAYISDDGNQVHRNVSLTPQINSYVTE